MYSKVITSTLIDFAYNESTITIEWSISRVEEKLLNGFVSMPNKVSHAMKVKQKLYAMAQKSISVKM